MHESCDLVMSDPEFCGPTGNVSFLARLRGRALRVRTRLPGLHNMVSAAAGVSVATVLGVPFEDSCRFAESAATPLGRLAAYPLLSGALVIDDTWNASPESYAAAVSYLSALPFSRKVVFSGPMAELGPEPAPINLGWRGNWQMRERARCVGSAASLLGVAAEEAGLPTGAVHYAASVEDAVAIASELLLDADTVVLVKGSGNARMERLSLALVAERHSAT